MNDPRASEDRLFATAPVFDREGVLAVALFTPMLFIVQFGSYGALLFLIATVAFAALRRASLPAIVRERWFLLPFPAFALLSMLWSNVPYETVKHALEFAATILAAILIATPRNPRSLLCGLFASFLLYTAVSFAFGHKVDVGDYGARALSGLNDSKNEEADIAAVGFVISTFLFLSGVWTKNAMQCAITLAAALLQAYVVAAALSAGAVAGSAVAVATLLLLFLLRRASPYGRGAMLSITAVCALAVAVLFEASGSRLAQFIAGWFGKDPTLTGRTYLWSRARDLVADHPLLGQGFAAFWQHGNLDAEGLWQFAQITTREGFNFHNTFYDSLISLGWIGTAIYGLTIGVGIARTGIAYIRRPGLVTCFWLALAAYLLVRMPTECEGLNEFYFSTVLLFASLGAARAPSPAPLLAGRRAQPLFAVNRTARPTATAAAGVSAPR